MFCILLETTNVIDLVSTLDKRTQNYSAEMKPLSPHVLAVDVTRSYFLGFTQGLYLYYLQKICEKSCKWFDINYIKGKTSAFIGVPNTFVSVPGLAHCTPSVFGI